MDETYRGVVRGGQVVLLDRNTLPPDGTEVLVTVVDSVPGTVTAVLAAVEAPPHVPGEWVDELELLIAAGQRPPARNDPFAEDRENGEGG
jgi:hypothetical protein